MALGHPRTVWRSASEETRIGVQGGVGVTLALAALVVVFRDLVLGLSLLKYGVLLGNVTDDLVRELASGWLFLLPGFLAGVGAAVKFRADTGTRPSTRSLAEILLFLVAFPTTLAVLLGAVGFVGVFVFLLVDAGLMSALIMGVFLGGLLVGVAMGGATVLLLFVSVPAGIGLLLGRELAGPPVG